MPGFGVVEFAVEQPVIRVARPQGDGGETADDDQPGQHDTDALADAELLPNAEELLAELRKWGAHRLNLHPHEFLIGLEKFVAHFDHELKTDARLFHRDHRLVQRDVLAAEQTTDGVAGGGLFRADFVDGLGQRVGERAVDRFSFCSSAAGIGVIAPGRKSVWIAEIIRCACRC